MESDGCSGQLKPFLSLLHHSQMSGAIKSLPSQKITPRVFFYSVSAWSTGTIAIMEAICKILLKRTRDTQHP